MHHLHPGESYVQRRWEIESAVFAYIAALAMFSYDYILCLPREIEVMWMKPFRFATAVYFITRYLPFAGLIFNLAVLPSMSMEVLLRAEGLDRSPMPPHLTCLRVLHFIDTIGILILVAITGVLVAQTYAMYNQNPTVLVVLGALGLIIIILDCFEAAADTCIVTPLEALPQIGVCYSPVEERLKLISTGTICLLAFLTVLSVTVMVLIVYKILKIIQQMDRVGQCVEHMSLTALIIRESICMFGVTLLRFLNTLLHVIAPDTLNVVLNPLVLPLASIFISHFLINLRCVAESVQISPTHSLALTTSLMLDIDVQRSCSILSDFAMTRAVYRGSLCGTIPLASTTNTGEDFSRSCDLCRLGTPRRRTPSVDCDLPISETPRDCDVEV